MLIRSSLTELCSEYMYLQCTTINPIVNSLYSFGICCVPLFDRRPVLEPRVLCSPSSAGSFSMKLNWMACQIPRADSLGKETLAGQHGHVCVLPFPWECPFVRICNLKAIFFWFRWSSADLREISRGNWQMADRKIEGFWGEGETWTGN